MENFIEVYLIRNHYCPLPNVGTLVLHEHNAKIQSVNKQIEAPFTEIRLENKYSDTNNFIQFIAKKKSIKYDDARKMLINYCDNIISIDQFTEKKINNIGQFFINTTGVLSFRQTEIAIEFVPPVEAIRVTRPNQTHKIRVGDQERDAIFKKVKTEITGKIPRKFWWISALIILVAALSICIYANQLGLNVDFWNNKTKIKPVNSTKTYRIIQ